MKSSKEAVAMIIELSEFVAKSHQQAKAKTEVDLGIEFASQLISIHAAHLANSSQALIVQIEKLNHDLSNSK